jgi:hypothetical protein
LPPFRNTRYRYLVAIKSSNTVDIEFINVALQIATPTIHIGEEISLLEMGQTDALSTRTYCTRWSMTVLPSFQSGATTLWMPLRSLATTLLWFTGSQVCGDQVRLSETPTLLHPHESSPAAMLSSIDPSLPARTQFTWVWVDVSTGGMGTVVSCQDVGGFCTLTRNVCIVVALTGRKSPRDYVGHAQEQGKAC